MNSMEKTGIILYFMLFLGCGMYLIYSILNANWLESFLAFGFMFSSIGMIFTN